ncbi:MAG: hypothetical protein GEV09_25160 [Pseudonocardiaceae bacterium]|nr:hypothetical protein [Pseudonocardiaceae bacterium]
MLFTRRRLLALSGTALSSALVTAGCAPSDRSVGLRRGPKPKPGVPLLAHVRDGTPLLVIPMRPGKNLVHFPASAGEDLSVTAENGRRVRATARPGAEGTWAGVDLPAGRSDLTVERGGSVSTVPVSTGSEPPLPGAVGDDGPECASAALGGLVAGSRARLSRSPSDALAPADATALRRLVGHIASRGAPGITVAADGSQRAQQAAQVVRDSAAQANIPTSSAPEPSSALVIVAGWSRSAQLLGDVAAKQATQPMHTAGVYLAPWLQYSPVVTKSPISYVPLGFNPSDERSLAYPAALANAFGGEMPSTSGFDQWRTTRHETSQESLVLYASAQVRAMQMMHFSDDMPGMSMGGGHRHRHRGYWVSNGTCVPVSGPLPT